MIDIETCIIALRLNWMKKFWMMLIIHRGKKLNNIFFPGGRDFNVAF